VRGPGFTLIFVPIQQMARVSLRTVTMQIPSQKIITKDNVSIDIAAVAYYHISDPEKAVIVIENVYNAINQISQTTVRNVVGRFSLDQLLSDTAGINLQIKNVIDGHTEPWGTKVTAVEIKDIVLPDNMQRAIPSCGEARPSGRHYHAASRGTSAPHPADDGGNLGRKELDHHFPRTIYDVGARSLRAIVKGFSIKIALPAFLSLSEIIDQCQCHGYDRSGSSAVMRRYLSAAASPSALTLSEIDLRERRIARVRVIACRLRPVLVGADRRSSARGRDVSLRCGDRYRGW
jgi:hypothetical protein